MTDLERMLIQHQCADLVVRFHVYIDEFEHDKILSLFAADAVWYHKFAGTLRGLDQIKGYLDSKRTNITTQHVTTNVVIDVVDGTRARGSCYYTYYHSEPHTPVPILLNGPTAVGRYRDEFVLTEQGWRFSMRNPENLFEATNVTALSIAKAGAKWG